MKNWENLSFVQKIFVGLTLLAMVGLAPEIALLLQFGGMEVAFAFLLFTLKPIFTWWQHSFGTLKKAISLAVILLRHSASAKPAVFTLQASFCLLAVALTGSTVFAFSFFMPGLMMNSVLV